ncbi:MAG: dihydrolipoamide acetyltransferase family protein [Xanthomonadales bacterium]
MKVLMPQLGETVNEGTVVTWHKKPGDEVTKNEILLDVETEKVAVEIPAPIAGILIRILVDAGETVNVGTVLAEISGPDDSPDDESNLQSPQAAGEVTQTESVNTQAAPAPAGKDGERLSPAVRRLIAEKGLDGSLIQGTGRDGRLTRRDVLSYLASQQSGTPAEQPALAATDERLPFDRIRRATAAHMLRSKSTSPHVLQTIEADFSAVDRLRLQKRDSWREDHGFSLSYLPFVARAVCLAIGEFPHINASVDGDTLVVHSAINLAFAVDLNFAGLVAPVIRDAAELKVSALAHRINNVVKRARNNKLSADDLSGGTYTLSNPGPYGTLFTAPIINQPQVAILSIDGIAKRPVVIEGPEGDSLGIRPVGVLAQSFDHRAFDGAYSAAFLNRLKSLLEQQDWALEF